MPLIPEKVHVVMSVTCHECQEGFSIYINIFILYYAQFLHTEKKLMTLLTHDTYDTQKKNLKKVAQKF